MEGRRPRGFTRGPLKLVFRVHPGEVLALRLQGPVTQRGRADRRQEFVKLVKGLFKRLFRHGKGMRAGSLRCRQPAWGCLGVGKFLSRRRRLVLSRDRQIGDRFRTERKPDAVAEYDFHRLSWKPLVVPTVLNGPLEWQLDSRLGRISLIGRNQPEFEERKILETFGLTRRAAGGQELPAG